MLFEEWPVLIGIGRVALYNKTTEDRVRGSSGKKDLMAVFGIPFPFDDDVGVVLEEGDHLLRGRDLIALAYATVGLIDNLTEDTYCPFQSPSKLMAQKGVFEVAAFIRDKLRDRCYGIAFHQPGIVEKIPVGFLPYGILPCIEDCHDPLLYNPSVITELITGLGDEFLPFCEPPGDDADAVAEKGRIRGMVNVGLYRR